VLKQEGQIDRAWVDRLEVVVVGVQVVQADPD